MFESKKPQRLALVHAAHLEAVGFENITWGDPRKGVYGRASKAILYALKNPGTQLQLGCGSLAPGTPIVSEVVFQLMVDRGREIPGLEHLSNAQWETALCQIVHFDTQAQVTVDELRNAGARCLELGVEELVLISSPCHLPRCLRDALVLREPDGPLSGIEVGVAPSDTDFVDAVPADVVIFEPPHRKDRHGVPVHRAVKKIFAHLGTQEGAERVNVVLESLGDPGKFAAMLAVARG